MVKLLFILLVLFNQSICRISDPKIIDNKQSPDRSGSGPSNAPFTFVKMEHKFLEMTEGVIDVGPKEITLSGDGITYKLEIIFLSWYAELMPDIGVWNKYWDDTCQLGQRYNEFSEEIQQLQESLEFHSCQCRFLMEQMNLDVNATHSVKNTYFMCFKNLEDLDLVDNKISDNYIQVIKESPIEEFGYPELLRIYTIMIYIEGDPNFQSFVQSDIQINEKICITGSR